VKNEMGGQSKTEYSTLDYLKACEGFSESHPLYPLFKKKAEIEGEVSEEEIQNHYNVYVYKVLPNPPDKKESLFK
jgi:hypothetical protein